MEHDGSGKVEGDDRSGQVGRKALEWCSNKSHWKIARPQARRELSSTIFLRFLSAPSASSSANIVLVFVIVHSPLALEPRWRSAVPLAEGWSRPDESLASLAVLFRSVFVRDFNVSRRNALEMSCANWDTNGGRLAFDALAGNGQPACLVLANSCSVTLMPLRVAYLARLRTMRLSVPS